jgi:uncharacterized protein (DUF1697 family)
MPRYVAFLRGINVGGHRIKMDRLRELFAELGLAQVATFIASGNVLFDTDAADLTALEREAEAHLRQALGYEVATFIRSLAEVAAVAAHRPFPAEELEHPSHSLYVLFLSAPLDETAHSNVEAIRTEVDAFHVHGREIYWLVRGKLTGSLVSGPVLAKATGGVSATARNITTVRKLAEQHAATGRAG